MEPSLSDIFQNVVSTPPQMEYSKKIRVRYAGTEVIPAIKTLRYMFGLTLKSAKQTIEWEGGFMLPEAVMGLLFRLYTETARNADPRKDWVVVRDLPPIEL